MACRILGILESTNDQYFDADAFLDAMRDKDLCRSAGRGVDPRTKSWATPDTWTDPLNMTNQPLINSLAIAAVN